MSPTVTSVCAVVIGLVLAVGVAMILGFLATCLTGIVVGTFKVVRQRQEGAARTRLETHPRVS